MYIITSYEIINGSKIQSREKNKPAPSLEYINELQERAERLWNHTVYINYKVPVSAHIPHR